VNCPKCGAKNKGKSEQCGACGILFIKWLIAQHKRDEKKIRKKSAAPRRWSVRAWVAVALAVGIGAGLWAGHRSGGETAAVEQEKAFVSLSEVPLGSILADAEALGERYGASISERHLRGFVLQGMDSFAVPVLREEAKRAGKAPAVEDISQTVYKEFKRTPYRCVLEGKIGYYTYLGKELEPASECWAIGTEGRIENKLMVVYYFWERLQWVPEKGRWALFTKPQERLLYRAFIDRLFDARAEADDLKEAKRMFSEAGGDSRRLQNALATAFRTRARRAGAEYRLGHL